MNEDRDSRPKVQIPSAVATPTIPSKEASNSAILTSQSPKQAYPSILAEPDLIIIEKRSGWHWIHWKDLWRHRELLYFLVWRDVKVRYKQTALGVAWAVLQPLAMMLVLSLFFGRYAEMPSAKIPYPLFLFAGLLPWFFFCQRHWLSRPERGWQSEPHHQGLFSSTSDSSGCSHRLSRRFRHRICHACFYDDGLWN